MYLPIPCQRERPVTSLVPPARRAGLSGGHLWLAEQLEAWPEDFFADEQHSAIEQRYAGENSGGSLSVGKDQGHLEILHTSSRGSHDGLRKGKQRPSAVGKKPVPC